MSRSSFSGWSLGFVSCSKQTGIFDKFINYISTTERTADKQQTCAEASIGVNVNAMLQYHSNKVSLHSTHSISN